MPEIERTRLREREPRPADSYERLVKQQMELRDRGLQGAIVLKDQDRPWEQSRQGRLKWFISRSSDTGSALINWLVFKNDIRTHSGKHRHQGGLVIYVLEGEGYTEVDGEMIGWEAGDLLLLPIKPDGVEHKHYNKRPGERCQWIAFIYLPYQDEVGFYLEQQEDSPDFK
jgi:quercetin dioxygenase-like cupin family protein